MPRTLGPILEISYDYLIHIVVWNHSLMCLVLIRYKTTTKVFVINNLDFGSISTGVGLSILISNLSKKRVFFADFLFYQLSLVCFYHLHIWLVHIYFYYFEKFFRDIYLFYAHCFLSTLLHNFDFLHTITHILVFSVHKFKNSLIRCRKRSICLQYCGTLFLVSWRRYSISV